MGLCTWKLRLIYAALVTVTITAGLGARALLSGALAKALGVILYGVMMVWLVRLVRPGAGFWLAGVLALAICWGIEALQATLVPARINARAPNMRLVLGEHFLWTDLGWYALGVIVAMALDATVCNVVRCHRPSSRSQ